ncbi:class I SAM-dependent methyltransferase [uncultured Sphingomonas sp.]|uniref:class I SAM-dependent methyltransferase n=1 Tax=uncultured Sphingomonas sp. TaxID=158754 RepID=UPI0025EBA076|nr:class I SAM-dependent methyltransferase [uncultured Sphingomonas sp.]
MGQIDLVPPPPSGEMLLDPFGYQAGIASRIEGLGGTLPHEHDPAYAFHTHYVEVAEGPVNFVIRFTGLRARRGSLQLRVHMIGDEPRAILINTARIQLNRLMAMGGETSIRFEGYRGVTYALYGGIVGETDAVAEGLMITLDRPAADNHVDEVAIEARNTSFRNDTIRPEVRLLSLGGPTLAEPVSQPATARQMREPAFSRWASALQVKDAPLRTQWAHAFVMQALNCYGMLQPGAHGLGFSEEAAAFRPVFADMGVQMSIGAVPSSPDLIARELVNFDFIWSIDVAQRFGSPDVGQWFTEAALRCLRPGGLAIHVVPFDPSATQRGEAPLADWMFGRGDIERVALGLISREHEVAQVKVAGTDFLTGPVTGNGLDAAAFGVIARKAPLPA